MMNLNEFLHDSIRNAWINYESAEVYLRKSKRYLIEDKIVECIDIANITCERKQEGTFTRLVQELQTKAKLPLFLENTYKEFAVALLRHGWIIVPRHTDTDIGVFCLYLPLITIAA